MYRKLAGEKKKKNRVMDENADPDPTPGGGKEEDRA